MPSSPSETHSAHPRRAIGWSGRAIRTYSLESRPVSSVFDLDNHCHLRSGLDDMKSQIKQRLRRLGRHRRSEAIWPKGMPRLPERRRRALTPSTSCEVLARECLMFTKLPYVIRRDILILAFGDRVLHMDLLNRAPHPPCGPWNIRIEDFPQQHCKSMAVYKDEGTWHWSGSICHRNPPVFLKGAMGKRDDGAILPWDDHSRADHTRYCDEWPGEGPSKCRIGVMGWLLSCRQA